jgi:hypothetical protein
LVGLVKQGASGRGASCFFLLPAGAEIDNKSLNSGIDPLTKNAKLSQVVSVVINS